MQKEKLFDLLRIGLTEGEAKVYIALTELGSSTVGPIVKKSGVAYSNVYDILDRLAGKGVISFIVKNKTRHFQAASPSNLIDYLDKKEQEIIEQKDALKKALPELEKLRQFVPSEEAEIFIGKKGLKTAYDKFSTAGKDYVFFYIHEPEYEKDADLFYFSIQHLLKTAKIRGIANEYARTSEFMQKSKYIDERYVDFPIPGNIEVCENKLLLVSWKKPIIAVLVHSESIADNFRQYFEVVWKQAKK